MANANHAIRPAKTAKANQPAVSPVQQANTFRISPVNPVTQHVQIVKVLPPSAQNVQKAKL